MLRERIIKGIQSTCGSSRALLNLGHSSFHTRYVPIKKASTGLEKTHLSTMLPSSLISVTRDYSASIISLATDYKSMYLPSSSITTKKKLDVSVKSSSSLSWDILDEDDYDVVTPSSYASPNVRTHQDVFPSIIIDKNGIEPQGTFAEAQTEFLEPDMDTVQTLSNKLTKAKMGVVAHYYMDVELQSVLQQVSSLQQQQTRDPEASFVPNVAIADSLAMGDYAVNMVKHNNIESIICLGVDFMAESVSAILHRNGYGHVPVYRSTQKSIGCSLASSAETDMYQAWLRKAALDDNPSLHVIYINTSLETKAISSSIIPTITVTSSNVIRTILQSAAQVEDLKIYFGPDTYMGQNLLSYFDMIIQHPSWTDHKIQQNLHPEHTNDTLKKLRDSINVYANGNCIVHHMFGNDVVNMVKDYYEDAYITAHLEVPSEMFRIAMEKSLYDMGVVGSTSDILNFISKKVQEHASTPGSKKKIKFVLGTEAGMVTSIIRNVQTILEKANNSIQAEIIFPVASEAFTSVRDNDLMVVPGVKSSEGCSTSGGCATCPFMKMNDLNTLEDVIDLELEKKDRVLVKHLPPKNRLFNDEERKVALFGDRDVMDLAVEPIMHMRKYMNDGFICGELVDRINNSADV